MSSSSSHITSSSSKLTMWQGFEDELQKIASNLAVPKIPKPTGTVDVKKMMHNQKSALSTRKPKYTQVHSGAPPAPAQMPDPLSSAKTIPPPPVTAGGL